MAEKKKDKGSGYQQQFFPNQVDYGTEPTDVEGPLPTSFQIGGFGGEDIGDYDQYGWLQDFIKIFRPYIEGQDIDDIDRIKRQEEANAFMDILRGVQNGTVDPNELRNFEFEYLSEIPGWNDYFQGVLENLDNGEDEGEQPDEFQGLYDKYGKDAVDAAKEKYDEIVKLLKILSVLLKKL